MAGYVDTDWTFLRLTGASIIGWVDLPIVGASPDDMFVLRGVDGLGAPEIDVSISGKKFQARQPRNRQIVATIGLNPDYTAGDTPTDLRSYIYGMLTGDWTGPEISVIVMNGPLNELMRTEGYVSKIEAAIFSKDPAVQITIDCLSPYFHALTPVSPLDDGDFNQFDASPQWPNKGSAPSGFYMEATFGAAYDYFQINNIGNNKRMRFEWFNKLGVHGLVGSRIFLSSEEGNKFAILWNPIGGGSYTSYDLLSAMTVDSEWFQLHVDMNQFGGSAPNITWNDVHYTPQYWGV